ncbi:MAG: cell wall metabolism sensor histidine kinase WalK [Anaerolineae bacterium]|nr:cell wall metabolism sensor histidine kinase WalK [Anaerolineae bacterium]
MNRLWVRLSLTFMAVVIIGFVIISVVSVQLIRISLEQSDANRDEVLPASVTAGLANLYHIYGDWRGVTTYLDLAQEAYPPLRDSQYALVSSNGTLVAGQSPATFGIAESLPIVVDGQTAGALLVGASENPPPPFRPFGIARGVGIEEFMLLVAFVGSVIGILFGVLMSRTLTTPLDDLAAAAQAIGKGDFQRQVKVSGTSEIRSLGESFNRMADALRNAEVLRRNLVADVAHELRTPITALQTSLYALIDDTYPVTKQEIAGLYEQTRLLSRLVNDLHELSLADARQLPLRKHRVDISAALEELVTPFRMVAETKAIDFDVVKAGKLPDIEADEARINQVLHNLLSNALRHTPEGGTITLTLSEYGDGVQIAVTDTGEGIPPEHLPHIFERFYRGDAGRSRDMGGTGLGLAVAKAIVEAHGGEILAESEIGKGTSVKVRLPRYTAQDKRPQAVA